MTPRLRVRLEAFYEGLSRLADLAPATLPVRSEETDWGLVGGDLREAIEAVTIRPRRRR